MRRVVLVALLALILATGSAQACGNCQKKKCLFGACKCLPVISTSCIVPKVKDLFDPATVNRIRKCIQQPYTCLQDEIKNLIPGLDTTQCKTEEMKRKATEGGWKVYYGPRVWDSKVGVNLIALFFPATSAAASANLYNELENQANELVRALEFAIQQEKDEALGNLKNVFKSMFNTLLSGRVPEVALNRGKFGVKLQFFNVKCNNKLPGGIELPSEGYSRWVFGWRLDAELTTRFSSLKSGTESKRSSLDTGGTTKLPTVAPMALKFRNSCRFPVNLAVTWKLPSNEGRVCRNGNIEPNGWCVGAWFRYDVGETATIGRTLNPGFFYTAFTTDKQISWTGPSNWGLDFKPCTAGRSDCYSWLSVGTGDVYESNTHTLTCTSAPKPKFALAGLVATNPTKLTPSSSPALYSVVGQGRLANVPGPAGEDLSNVTLRAPAPRSAFAGAPIVQADSLPGAESTFAPTPGGSVNSDGSLALPPDVAAEVGNGTINVASLLLAPGEAQAIEELAKSPISAAGLRAADPVAVLGTPNAGAVPVLRFFDAGPPAVGSPNLAIEEIQTPTSIDGPLPLSDFDGDAPAPVLPSLRPTVSPPRSATPATAPRSAPPTTATPRAAPPTTATPRSAPPTAVTPTAALRSPTPPQAAPPSTTRTGVPPTATLASPPLRAASPPPPPLRIAPAPARAANATTGK